MKLNEQVAVWRDQWRASLPPSDEPFASPSVEVLAPSSSEVPTIPPPPKVYHEQVIEDDLVVQIEESDGSRDDLEWIDNPNGVLYL